MSTPAPQLSQATLERSDRPQESPSFSSGAAAPSAAPAIAPTTAAAAAAPSSATNTNSMRTYTFRNTQFVVDAKYELSKDLGAGSYGVVCCGVNKLHGRKVAIKKISRAFDNITQARRTLREVRLLRHFHHHDNIVALEELLDFKGSASQLEDVYLVLEYMDTDLHHIIRSSQPLTDDHVRYFLYQILRGLKYIHSAEVLHRDLKPSNLLVNADCDIKICDFGMARGVAASPEEHAMFMTSYVATRWYRAPEIMLSFNHYSKAIDVWSAGCIFAEMMGRHTLFPGKDYVHQLNLIIGLVGTPDKSFIENIGSEKVKKYMNSFPFRERVPFARLFPSASEDALDLLGKMLTFDPAARISVEDALEHPYLAMYHAEIDEPTCPSFDFEFEKLQLTKEELQQMVLTEIKLYHPSSSSSSAIIDTSSPAGGAAPSVVGLESGGAVSSASSTTTTTGANTHSKDGGDGGGSSSSSAFANPHSSQLPVVSAGFSPYIFSASPAPQSTRSAEPGMQQQGLFPALPRDALLSSRTPDQDLALKTPVAVSTHPTMHVSSADAKGSGSDHNGNNDSMLSTTSSLSPSLHTPGSTFHHQIHPQGQHQQRADDTSSSRSDAHSSPGPDAAPAKGDAALEQGSKSASIAPTNNVVFVAPTRTPRRNAAIAAAAAITAFVSKSPASALSSAEGDTPSPVSVSGSEQRQPKQESLEGDTSHSDSASMDSIPDPAPASKTALHQKISTRSRAGGASTVPGGLSAPASSSSAAHDLKSNTSILSAAAAAAKAALVKQQQLEERMAHGPLSSPVFHQVIQVESEADLHTRSVLFPAKPASTPTPQTRPAPGDVDSKAAIRKALALKAAAKAAAMKNVNDSAAARAAVNMVFASSQDGSAASIVNAAAAVASQLAAEANGETSYTSSSLKEKYGAITGGSHDSHLHDLYLGDPKAKRARIADAIMSRVQKKSQQAAAAAAAASSPAGGASSTADGSGGKGAARKEKAKPAGAGRSTLSSHLQIAAKKEKLLSDWQQKYNNSQDAETASMSKNGGDGAGTASMMAVDHKLQPSHSSPMASSTADSNQFFKRIALQQQQHAEEMQLQRSVSSPPALGIASSSSLSASNPVTSFSNSSPLVFRPSGTTPSSTVSYSAYDAQGASFANGSHSQNKPRLYLDTQANVLSQANFPPKSAEQIHSLAQELRGMHSAITPVFPEDFESMLDPSIDLFSLQQELELGSPRVFLQ